MLKPNPYTELRREPLQSKPGTALEVLRDLREEDEKDDKQEGEKD